MKGDLHDSNVVVEIERIIRKINTFVKTFLASFVYPTISKWNQYGRDSRSSAVSLIFYDTRTVRLNFFDHGLTQFLLMSK